MKDHNLKSGAIRSRMCRRYGGGMEITMKIDLKRVAPIGNIVSGGQDGAIYGKYLFSINSKGNANVYDIDSFGGKVTPDMKIDTFTLDRAELICPHSNAVCFGREFYEEGDEFPLLYTNIYNNYAKAAEPLKGVCLVYRVMRDGNKFSTALVQIIEIGFTEDASLWKMSEDADCTRPYGNFTVDAEKGVYYAFTMRAESDGTRYFAFDIPRARDGEMSEKFGVKKVVLKKEDIKYFFDCEHHYFLQGACCHNSLIYSLEGFHTDELPPRLRVIDPVEKKQLLAVDLRKFTLGIEPEFIDFRGDTCYYCDERGNLYIMEFENR